MSANSKHRVSYFYDSECDGSAAVVGLSGHGLKCRLVTLRPLSGPACAGEFSTYYFGQNHPMKPHRLTMTNHLVLGYGLHKHMDMFVSAATAAP